MLVRDFMTSQVISLQETDSLLEANMAFVRTTFRTLPVVRGKHVVGIITEHDIKKLVPTLLTRMSPENYSDVLETTPISRAMTRDPATVAPDHSIYEAAMLFYDKRLACLPVVENGDLVGIISTTDMLGRGALNYQ